MSKFEKAEATVGGASVADSHAILSALIRVFDALCVSKPFA